MKHYNPILNAEDKVMKKQLSALDRLERSVKQGVWKKYIKCQFCGDKATKERFKPSILNNDQKGYFKLNSGVKGNLGREAR